MREAVSALLVLVVLAVVAVVSLVYVGAKNDKAACAALYRRARTHADSMVVDVTRPSLYAALCVEIAR